MEIEARDGNATEAARYAKALRYLSATNLTTYLAQLTAPEQLRFFRMWDDPGLHASLRLGIQDKALSDSSAEWLLNGKAKIAEVLATVNRHERGGEAARKFQQAIEHQVYCLYGRAPGTAAELQQVILDEELKKQELAASRAVRLPRPWYTLNDLRQRLAVDEVYIDVFCLPAESGSERAYHAWVITKLGPVRVVSLGSAQKIEDLVQTFRDHQENFLTPKGAAMEFGPAEAEKNLRERCLKPLSRLILDPLLPAINDKRRWIISPDGPLWNVPWAALIWPNSDKYVIEDEKVTFRYVISGRDLLRPPVQNQALGAPLILANPDLDHAPAPAGWRHRTAPDLFLLFKPLPASRDEGQQVATCLKQFMNVEAPLTDARVTKESLLRLPRAPRLLYLSTPGFFSLPTELRVDDPLLRCGIAFAGWYYVPDGKQAGTEALPGLMTGAEVLAVNLQDTDLVVLSACQSGTGVISYGQSPADLRQAFHLAGARAVVSSLWGVEDKATRDLMVAFIQSYARTPTADKAAALASAQREMIKSLRKPGRGKNRHSHPFFWAAFTLSGS